MVQRYKSKHVKQYGRLISSTTKSATLSVKIKYTVIQNGMCLLCLVYLTTLSSTNDDYRLRHKTKDYLNGKVPCIQNNSSS